MITSVQTSVTKPVIPFHGQKAFDPIEARTLAQKYREYADALEAAARRGEAVVVGLRKGGFIGGNDDPRIRLEPDYSSVQIHVEANASREADWDGKVGSTPDV